ncbi:MAG: sulfotransferase [Actinomycetota bacterium]
MVGPPFFIVGSARSGTTMLRLMLNAHPEVAVPPESRFAVELWDGRDEVDAGRFVERLAGHSMFHHWDLPGEVVREELGGEGPCSYRAAVSAAYEAYARVHGKTRWGDKTPRYVEHIPFLARLFPDARFVHLVRDGRNVALSYADVPFGPKTVGKAADLWARRVSAGMRAGRALEAGRYLELCYEDLVEDPEGEAKDLCDFLDLPFDPDMLDYTERARDAVLPRAARFNPHVTERPTARTRSWQDDLEPIDAEMFEAIAGGVLSELGYERRYPQPRAWVALAARLARKGAPIGRLAETRPTTPG